MAIRFACPSCHQPIEVDDNWANQSVGCPYCKKVVTAPAESSWPAGGIHVAEPAGEDWEADSPTSASTRPSQQTPYSGYPYPPPAAGRSTLAWVALILAFVYLGAMLIGWYIMGQVALVMIQEQLGSDGVPTMQEQQRAMEEMVTKTGRLPGNAASATAGLVAVLAGVVGVICAIVSLVRSEPLKVVSIPALIVCLSSLCCGLYPAISNMQLPVPPVPATAPAEESDPKREGGEDAASGDEASADTLNVTHYVDCACPGAIPLRA